jgi:hypothetical protein
VSAGLWPVGQYLAEHYRHPLPLGRRRASVHFVRRDVTRLDVQRHRTELGQGWITTVEQTVLDLIARPNLGGVPDAAAEATTALIPRADMGLVHELAISQRRQRALDQAVTAHPVA